MILGHGNEDAAALAHEQALKGLSYGAATYLEVEIAEKIKSMMPAIELLRMVNSGTEATMSAIRLARGYTGRNKLVKFNGCYHGHSDCLLAQAGSGVLSMSSPSSPGVPAEIVKDTINLEFNDSDGLEEYFKTSGDSTSALIIEPIAGNMNFIPADKEFLQQIRKLCDKHGVVLIFDEVMSGFRVARGGAQEHYGIVSRLSMFRQGYRWRIACGGIWWQEGYNATSRPYWLSISSRNLVRQPIGGNPWLAYIKPIRQL